MSTSQELADAVKAQQFASCVSLIAKALVVLAFLVLAAKATFALENVASQLDRRNDIECIEYGATGDSFSPADRQACG